MEADWSVALAADDPVVSVPWSGVGLRFLDLRQTPQLVDEVEEVRTRPELRTALLLLNDDASPFITAKCDVWTSSAEQGDSPLDPYEMDAETCHTDFGAGSYIDLVRRDVACFTSFDQQEQWMREVTETFRATPANAVRVELVLRRAEVYEVAGFATTWYVEGCGATAAEANKKWGEALKLGLSIILALAPEAEAAKARFEQWITSHDAL